ncbi:hypothetical protein BRC82_04125 [Halobacteriales archaeon QS_1_67_19]|nr:MAG: hypothetical protein BRC82_04125 [Halobacteriales archaeon QS_1_67_19]
MDFDTTTTAIGFLALFGIVAIGTLMSPMTTSTVMMVLGGLAVFGLLTLLLGVKHGEYRATR